MYWFVLIEEFNLNFSRALLVLSLVIFSIPNQPHFGLANTGRNASLIFICQPLNT